jgi:hypothetical protein
MIAGNSSWMYANGLLSLGVGMASVRSGSLRAGCGQYDASVNSCSMISDPSLFK